MPWAAKGEGYTWELLSTVFSLNHLENVPLIRASAPATRSQKAGNPGA